MKHIAHSTLLTTNKLGAVTGTGQHYPDAIRAFARLSYESIYVIDYADMSFEYVSENPLFLCGYTADEVLQLGYEFYFKQVPPADLELLTQINQAGFDFYAHLPVGERTLYSISYDFHLVHKNGKSVLVNHKLTPLFLTAEGKMWKSMCVVSLSRKQSAGHVIIQKHGSNEMWEWSVSKKIWRKSLKPALNEKELEVLRLYAQGFSIEQIAKRLHVVPDTVKYYRRKIFERLDVSNVADALSLAVSSKLI